MTRPTMNILGITCNEVFRVKWFEVRIEGIGNVEIMLDTIKGFGVTKTLNGTKKLRAWLQTEEGKAFVLGKSGSLIKQ
ncbi:hypothetical protein ABE237_13540 [Brevibacillus formosus]|uniref:hypothetical protein n=1 Tax=Brevibacillus TaxID=55080 RepID=UPI000D0ED357|nr:MULTISPECIES: hypothetical protein [Brevibacillus]MBG9945241.1 hypothetical protein [Brevibacillus formosus]MED1943595.1 hypothetical protein [Brevibacillus formosus]MED2000033.1 hypothetical protein [Brevibacillus formosus]MED2081830.1 hypothetical protein [Brevibacillus formosus]PSK19224.1 hypothetical protein C7R94_10670 [Brevibacillus sp. NRRL NRS-603]